MQAFPCHEEEWTLPRPDSPIPLHVRLWLPEGRPRALVQISHGMAEHIGRYADAAKALCAMGFAAAGHNHRGHGPECPKEERGYFADRDGWDHVIDDVRIVQESLRSRLPSVPLFLLGHSMGSFIATEYVLRRPEGLSGAIFLGTGFYPAAVCRAGIALASLKNPRTVDKTVDTVAFSGNNRGFAPARTPYDWLSRDEKRVDSYIADPLCGFVFTAGAYKDFFGGLLALCRESRFSAIPKDLPLLYMGGSRDPVGQRGGVRASADRWKRAGLRDVTVHLYEDARHELLNEINRDEVLADLRAWIDQHIIAKEGMDT